MKPWYNVRKAAQVAAFFARAEGGVINVLKLVKLIYISDRRHMEKYEFSILNDRLVSMDHGPVNSITFNYINGCQAERDGWEKYLTDRSDYTVGLAVENLDDGDLDELSEAEMETLNETWDKFGYMTKYALRDWTHKHCPEWEDPQGSSNPIPYERVFKFLGKENATELADEIHSERAISEAFAVA